MDSMFDLAIYILKFAIAGGFILLALKIMKIKKSSTVKAEVLHHQSKLSKARMALKGKVKKKANIFRAFVKVAVTEGDPIDTALKELTEINFETGKDFQNYFDISRRIVSLIHVDKNGKPIAIENTDLENDFMCSDFKTEMDIIRIIKDMSNVTDRVNARIEENNLRNPSNLIEKVDGLNFDSMDEVNRVFKTQGDENSPKYEDQSKKVS